MNRLKASIGILSIFILGTLVGASGTGYFMKQRIRDYVHGPEPPLAMILRRMSHDLDLTAEQQDKLRPILEHTRTRLTALRKKYRPEFQSVFDDSTLEIKAILTKDQRPKLDRLQEKMKHRPDGHGPGGRPPGPPPPSMDSDGDLSKALNLTKDQKSRADALLARSIERQNALGHAVQRERQAFSQRVKALETEAAKEQSAIAAQLEKILDARQMDIFRRTTAPPGPPPPPGPFPD